MTNKEKTRQIIEDTGKNYNKIIFEDDIIPRDVYCYQIGLRDQIIKNLLGDKKFGNVLDLGCGTGFHQKTLGRYAEYLIGADMSFGALVECKRLFFGEYLVCDINYLPFKENSLDCIWIAGVLHHVPDNLVNVITNNIARTLKRGGIILIDEPNRWNPLNYLILKLSKADPTGEERPLSSGTVRKILIDSNLKIVRAEWYEFFAPFGLLLKNTFFFQICESADSFLKRSPLRSILLRWVIYAKKE
ncbi:MAG: class I SAM-dependent methyltransferase [Methanoregula sp.]|nr:class I SAM-dependent methyltransferase [Methanoregula sp.]